MLEEMMTTVWLLKALVGRYPGMCKVRTEGHSTVIELTSIK